MERATEIFGPCGIGWGIEVVSERFERFDDSNSQHIAHVRLWYMRGDKKGVIEQMGQTRSSYMSKDGRYIVDEDAGKKSVTDAMVKCLSMLGFAGDIFSGRWDDSNYVKWAREETDRRENPPPPPINKDQATEIGDLIKEANADKAQLFEWVSQQTNTNIKSVDEIPNIAYAHLKKMLEKKISKAKEDKKPEVGMGEQK